MSLLLVHFINLITSSWARLSTLIHALNQVFDQKMTYFHQIYLEWNSRWNLIGCITRINSFFMVFIKGCARNCEKWFTYQKLRTLFWQEIQNFFDNLHLTNIFHLCVCQVAFFEINKMKFNYIWSKTLLLTLLERPLIMYSSKSKSLQVSCRVILLACASPFETTERMQMYL